MNVSVNFSPDTTDEPVIDMSGTSGFLNLTESPWSPTLLVDAGDQEYLRRLAEAASKLADRMDAAEGSR